MNIWIPSKGRPNPLASKLLSSAGVEHTIIVEPQDYDKYAAVLSKHAQLHTLPANDGGISYVRRYMIQLARELGNVKFWTVDDDIKNIFPTERVDGKLRQKKNSSPGDIKACFEKMEALFESLPEVVLASPCHAGTLWTKGTDIIMDTVHHSLNWIHTGRLAREVSYRHKECDGKEDLMLAADIVLSGGRLAIDCGVGVEHSPMGTKAGKKKISGGLQDLYKNWQRLVDASQQMETNIIDRREDLINAARHLSDKDKQRLRKMQVVKWYKPTWGEGDYSSLRYATLRKIWLETRER